MPHLIISVPANIYESILDLQHRVLAHDVEPDQARYEMTDLISPYCQRLPVEGEDTTEIVLQRAVMSFSKAK